MATKTYKLSEILEFSKKSRRKAGDGLSEGMYPFFTSSQIQSKWLNEADYPKESIILGTGGLPSIHISKDFSTSADTFILTSINPLISIKYVYYFLSGNIELLEKGFKGAGLKHLSKQHTEKILIPIPINKNDEPDLEEQDRIISLLKEAENLKNKRLEANHKTESLVTSLFIKMFGDPVINQKNWKKDKFINKIYIGTKLVNPVLEQYCFLPQIGGENISEKSGKLINISNASDKRITSNNFTFSEKHILYNKIRPYLNKVAFPQYSGICSADIYPLLPNDDSVNTYFLLVLLRSESFVKFAVSLSGRLRMPKLNKDQLGSFDLIIPPIELQNKFADLVKEIEEQKFKQNESTQKVDELFNAVMAKSFN